MIKGIFIIVLLGLIVACKTGKNAEIVSSETASISVETSKDVLFDSTRNRKIPILIYKAKTEQNIAPRYFVIISHGYGFNKGNPYLGYSFIAEFLVKKGCFVVSIQHELPTDDLLAMEGDLRTTRRPNWEKGVQNILFVTNYLKVQNPTLMTSNLVLIGHSNGGDMSVLFAEKYPEITDKVFTLDHRRMPIPRVEKPRFYSLRSNDQVADEGVLPNLEEQKKFGQIILQTPIKHNDMCNEATHEERAIILSFIQKQLDLKK
ncbi:MAG: alpha/beta hydrolase [Flavobacteriales bacterium]|nr:alpha/beta hydrolase [Flavobacteriales bacterium]